MINKLPESIFVTDFDELMEVIEKRKRKQVIYFIDMRKFGMTREEQIRNSQKFMALKHTSRSIGRLPIDCTMFVNEKYGRRKGLI